MVDIISTGDAIVYASQIYAVAPRALPAVVDALVHKSSQYFIRFRVDRPRRLAHWLGQMAHESAGLTGLEENLNYSAARLRAVFPSRVTATQAAKLARNPQAIANHVYGGRMGNTAADDGWRYRGRGLIHLTGRDNYRVYGGQIGIGLEANPDLAADPEIAIAVACAYWQHRGCNAAADDDDVERVTRIINGGVNGLSDRVRLTARAWAALFPAENPRILRSGASGHDVALLQGELLELGLGGIPDGTFGPATAARVRQLQRDGRVSDDGVVGPATRRVLQQALTEVRRPAA